MNLTIDVHGMLEQQAIKTIEQFVQKAPKDCQTITVIHGHRHGQALKSVMMDPNKIRHKRIIRRKYSKNPGETILVLDE